MNARNSTDTRQAGGKGDGSPNNGIIIAAVIGAVGAIVAAFVGGLFTGHSSSPQPTATVYVTKTATVTATPAGTGSSATDPTGGGTSGASGSSDGGGDPKDNVLWKGSLLIGTSGVTFSTIPPSQDSLPDIYWKTSPNQIYTSGIVVAPWDSKTNPTEAQCQNQTDTQAYPANYTITNPPTNGGLCVNASNVGYGYYHEVFIRLQGVVSTGIESATTVWQIPGH
jgi:hypothetical protein